MKTYVITIAREFGSGGKEIAMRLSNILGIPWYEKQILEMASEESGINKKYFVEYDEKLPGGYFLNHLKSHSFSEVVEPANKDFTSNINIFNIQAKIIETLAKTESCIIVGKCADYVLKDNDNVVSVFIGASRNHCVASLKEKLKISDSEAVASILRTDRYRSDYYKYYTRGKEWKNPNNYDICLNSGEIGREQCCELIIECVNRKLGLELHK